MVLTPYSISLSANSMIPPDLASEKKHAAIIENGSFSLEKYHAFLKELVKELSLTKSVIDINNIKSITEKYGVNEGDGNNFNSKIMHAINELNSQNHLDKNIVDKHQNSISEISGKIKVIQNEIRNQSLQRQTASRQLAAAENSVEKKMVTDGELTTSTSYAVMWLRLALFIGEVKESYVDFYADLMQKYTEMYESFNENVQKASSEAVSTGDDGNNVAFDINKMQAGYTAFQADVDRMNSELGSIDGWDSMSDDEKKQMTITLEPAYKVDSSGRISFNMDQYNSVSGTYPSGIKNGKVSTASYQAWLATFNAAGNAFQSNMQSFAQRYSQANNNFDTLNKILSAAISTLADSAKDVLKSLG